jgi:hypothetical protein
MIGTKTIPEKNTIVIPIITNLKMETLILIQFILLTIYIAKMKVKIIIDIDKGICEVDSYKI